MRAPILPAVQHPFPTPSYDDFWSTFSSRSTSTFTPLRTPLPLTSSPVPSATPGPSRLRQ
jgi:hypothetical protein